MRSSVRNVLTGTLAAAALMAGSVASAGAQTVAPSGTARVDFDAATTIAAAPASAASIYAPSLRANFAAQQQPAQTNLGPTQSSSGIGIGALAMVGFPKITNVNVTFDAKTTYGFGLWVGGNRNGVVGFTGEFIYLFKEKSQDGTTVKQQALEIPAVFHINFGSRDKNKPMGYAVLGPVFTINVEDKVTGGLTGDNFASADTGVLIGAGFEVARIGIEGRFNIGLTNIAKEESAAFNQSKERSFELVGKVRFN